MVAKPRCLQSYCAVYHEHKAEGLDVPYPDLKNYMISVEATRKVEVQSTECSSP